MMMNDHTTFDSSPLYYSTYNFPTNYYHSEEYNTPQATYTDSTSSSPELVTPRSLHRELLSYNNDIDYHNIDPRLLTTEEENYIQPHLTWQQFEDDLSVHIYDQAGQHASAIRAPPDSATSLYIPPPPIAQTISRSTDTAPSVSYGEFDNDNSDDEWLPSNKVTQNVSKNKRKRRDDDDDYCDEEEYTSLAHKSKKRRTSQAILDKAASTKGQRSGKLSSSRKSTGTGSGKKKVSGSRPPSQPRNVQSTGEMRETIAAAILDKTCELVKKLKGRCPECNILQSRAPDLHRHLATHVADLVRVRCVQCKEWVSRPDAMNRHWKISHEGEAMPPMPQKE
ncbi:hypothetical protein CPC08DRAFT_757479 [Agrocybe pediades]|nr:hypothetical protein CPC08DRAFT_757479 [Agrocybe pediades]